MNTQNLIPEQPVSQAPLPGETVQNTIMPMEETALGANLPPEETAPAEEVPTEDMGNGGYVDNIPNYLSTYYPDQDFSTPELQYQGAGKLLDAVMPFIEKLRGVMDDSPEMADFIYSAVETGDPLIALARAYSPDEVRAIAEEMNDAKYSEAKSQYEGKVKAKGERQASLDKNMKMSMDEIRSYMEDKKDWPEQRVNEFLDFVRDHYNDGFEGKIGKKNLLALEKSFTHDDDVSTASTTAAIQARNEKITQGRRTKKDLESLNLPELQSGANVEKGEQPADEFLSGLKAIANRKPVL